jgi:hypothetical protein
MMPRRPATREPQLWTGKQETSDGPSSTQEWCSPHWSVYCPIYVEVVEVPNWSWSTLIHWIFWGTVGQMISNRRSDVSATGGTRLDARDIFFLPLKWAEVCWQAIAARIGLQIPCCSLKRL